MAKKKRNERRFTVVDLDDGTGGDLVMTGEFTPEDLKSEASILRLAVQKWETAVAFHKAHPRRKLHTGGCATCSLCAKYRCSCVDCPVYRASGSNCCHDTPYVCHDHVWELKFLKALVPRSKEQPAAQRVLARWRKATGQ